MLFVYKYVTIIFASFWTLANQSHSKKKKVHPPGQHMVLFDPDESEENVIARARNEQTTLTAFFQANSNEGPLGALARQATYQDFPQFFVWNKGQKSWTIRKEGWALGRMYFVSPLAGERFYLRTLLTTTKGAQSFEDLRTVEGVRYDTFREACIAHGLLSDDGEWRLCLQEAVEFQTGHCLRQLFTTLLIYCNPVYPAHLWDEFRQYICDDLDHRLRSLGFHHTTEENIYDYGLYLLDQLLRENGFRLEDFATMPHYHRNWGQFQANRLIAEQLDYDREEQRVRLREALPLLNHEQRCAYDEIVHSAVEEHGQLFFLNGPGGTGKTFVYQTLCYHGRSEGWIVLCVASTGIAALLLPGGRTSHMMFKIPINGLCDTSTCAIGKNTALAELIRQTRLIIWDEVPAQHRFGPEAVDRTIRDIRNNDHPFGGITVVFGGDFQQTLPVVRHGSRAQVVSATLKESSLWRHIHVLHLSRNMRVQGDDAEAFSQWLLDIGHGRNLSDDSRVYLPSHMQSSSLDNLINFVYLDLSKNQPIPPSKYFLDRIILSPRNDEAYSINNEVLQRFPGNESICLSADSAEYDEDSELHEPIPVELLRSLNPSGLPPAELRLKPGCPLILLRNIAPARGLCNGTRMVLERISDRVLEVRILGGNHNGQVALIPRISLTPSDVEFNFTFKRRQFPVRLAFAMTINKAQGQSVKIVGIDLRTSVFSHGQLYVALSRATSSTQIQILVPLDNNDFTTTNVVWNEVLL